MNNERAVIGGNNPPVTIGEAIDAALSPFGDDIGEAENWADGTPVENEAQMKEVDCLLASIKEAIKALGPVKAEHVTPVYDEYKGLLATLNTSEKDLGRIRDCLVKSQEGFKRKLATEKAEAARVAAEQAAAAIAAAQEAHADASSIDDARAAEQAADAAKWAQINAKKAAKDTVKGLRTVKVRTVTDYKAFAGWVWQNRFDDLAPMLDELARRYQMEVPGVTVTVEKKAV